MITRNMFYQLCRFGIIGIISALVQVALVMLQVEQFAIHPLLANIMGFFCAFWVSYFGHRYWTFKQQAPEPNNLLRFLGVATFSFILNESLFYALIRGAELYYPLALVIVLSVIPPVTFILSQRWAFR